MKNRPHGGTAPASAVYPVHLHPDCRERFLDILAQKVLAIGDSICSLYAGCCRDECRVLQWGDIGWEQRSIHIRRNAVKITDEEIFTKAPKTFSGDRYVYFSLELEFLLREYRQECAWETETYDGRELAGGDSLFRRKGCRLPMTPSTFTWRFKLILKKHGLPEYLNVHSLRHTNASLLIANGTDVATVAGLLATASHPPRWTFILIPLTRTSRRPAKCSRRVWRSDPLMEAKSEQN